MVQIVRRGAERWELVRISEMGRTADGSRLVGYEAIAMVSLDPETDQYVVERMDWESGDWALIEGKSYVTKEAAFRSVTHPKEQAS